MMTETERKELTGGILNPDWVEWLMGWPVGWTSMDSLPVSRWAAWLSAFQIELPDCGVTGMAKCQGQRRLHGAFSAQSWQTPNETVIDTEGNT